MIGRAFKSDEHVGLALHRLFGLELMVIATPTIPRLRPSTRMVL